MHPSLRYSIGSEVVGWWWCLRWPSTNHEPLNSNWDRMIHDSLFQHHNYLTLMSGSCHLQHRSKLGLLRVIAWLALECIWADRIDGEKTQGSVIGDTALLINHQQVQQWPGIKISCWSVKKVYKIKSFFKKKKAGEGLVGGGVICL